MLNDALFHHRDATTGKKMARETTDADKEEFFKSKDFPYLDGAKYHVAMFEFETNENKKEYHRKYLELFRKSSISSTSGVSGRAD